MVNFPCIILPFTFQFIRRTIRMILQLTGQLFEPHHCYCDSLRFLYFVRSIPKPDKHLTIETLLNQYKIK